MGLKIRNQHGFAFWLSTGVSTLIALTVIFLTIHIFRLETALKERSLSNHASLKENSVSENPPPKENGIRDSNLESGDIIFRRGVSVESRVIMAMDGQFGYSHAGIIRKNGSVVEVIHASFGEEGQTREIIINEPIEKFLKSTSSSAAAVYRLNAQDKSLPLIALAEAERFLEAKTSFDQDYDLGTADKVYCTEFIWLVFKKAGVDLTGGKFDRLPSLVGDPNKDFILPGSLLNSSQLQKIWTSQ